jgi:hypothetical protein
MVGLLTYDDLARFWKETAVAWLRYYTGIFLEVLRKTMKTSVRIAHMPAKIRNEHAPSASRVLPSEQPVLYTGFKICYLRWVKKNHH